MKFGENQVPGDATMKTTISNHPPIAPHPSIADSTSNMQTIHQIASSSVSGLDTPSFHPLNLSHPITSYYR
jgi:hypothetical protein